MVSFTLESKIYKAVASSNNTFSYYRLINGAENYPDILTASVKPQKSIVGYPCLEANGATTFAVYQKPITASSYPEIYLAAGNMVRFDYLIDFYLSGRSQSSVFKITAEQMLSEEAKQYLNFRKAYAGCDNPLAPYVFINAYQINYNPGTYLYCGLSQDYERQNPNNLFLDKLPVYENQEIPTISPVNSYYDEVRKWTNASDIYAKRTQAFNKLNTLKDLHDVNALVEVLKEYEPYSCIWAKITLENRIHILKKLLEGSVNDYWLSFGNNQENLFNLVLETTPVEDKLSLLTEFSKEQNKLLLKAYNSLDLTPNDDFIATLTEWLLTTKPFEVTTLKSMMPQYTLNNVGQSDRLLANQEFLWRKIEGKLDGKIIKESNGQFYWWSDKEKKNIAIDPFDIVRIEFASSILGIEEGKVLLVPAIWAYRFKDSFYNQKLITLARVLVDATVIATTLGSGSSAVAAIEVGFAATDLFIVGIQDQVKEQFEDGETFIEAWDNLYAIYGGAIGGMGVTQLTIGTARKLSFTTKNLVENFKSYSYKAPQIQTNLLRMADFLKKWGTLRNIKNWEVEYYQILDYARTVELQAFQQSAINTSNRIALQIKDHTKVVVFNTVFNYQIALYETRNAVPYLTDIRWLPAGLTAEATVVDRIKPVNYENSYLFRIEKAELEIVLARGQYYLKSIIAEPVAIGLLSKYPDLRFIYGGIQKNLGNNVTKFENALKNCTDEVMAKFNQHPDWLYKLGDIENASEEYLKSRLDDIALRGKNFGVFKTATVNVVGEKHAILFAKIKNNTALSDLKLKFESLDDATKSKFLAEFKEVSDTDLTALNVNGAELVDVWKVNQGVNNVSLLKSFKSIPDNIQNHLKVRESDPGREIKGCHDKTQWDNNSVVKKESLITNPTYTVPINLPLSDLSVPEVVIISDVALSVPGVRVVEYRVPAISNSGRLVNLTTGTLKGGKPYLKTIYDPVIWTDILLENVCKEALQDAYRTGNLTTYPSPSVSVKFKGVTRDGYNIEGYFDVHTKKITTFYFY